MTVTLPAVERFGLLKEAIRTLHPAYFAMVMATGIVAISAHLLEMNLLSRCLAWINAPAFVVLLIMTLSRLILYPRQFLADLADHTRGVGFFTTVAGTCVLGSQFLLIFEGYQTAFVLWIAGTLLWLIFTYSVFTALMVKETKPPLAEGINGGWLVAVVATQSVSNLSGLLARHLAAQKELVLFVSLSLWLCGAMLYIWIISIIFYRYLFFKLAPSDLTPPYWVNMGAMAISTLAGTTLIANAGEWQFLAQLRPFLAGFTVLFWATATWWIPMLLILGCWRHLYKRFKIAYDPLYWGAVFPLGMYVACTFQLARVTELRVLALIPRYFIYVALAAWTLTFSGLLRSMYSGMRKGKEAPCAAGS